MGQNEWGREVDEGQVVRGYTEVGDGLVENETQLEDINFANEEDAPRYEDWQPTDDELNQHEEDEEDDEINQAVNNQDEVEPVPVSDEATEEEDFAYEERTIQLTEKSEQLKAQMTQPDIVSTIDFAMLDNDREYIEPRKEGMVTVEMVTIADIHKTKRVRVSKQDLFGLQEQLRKFGQIEPIHVVEYGDSLLLLSGYRRLEALTKLGHTEVLAYVDGTIPAEMVKYFEAMINGVEPYLFSEKMAYGKHFKDTQPNVGYDIIEGILGIRPGEFLKGLYIDTMKDEYADTYVQVEKGRLTIEQGFKKIDKEIEKRGKEEDMTAGEELNSGALDEQLRSTNELEGVQTEAHQQELGNRTILDPVLRRSVESRDGGYCQCCGFGKGEPDFMGAFNVHHMVAVQYGGTDRQSNLILLCNNCHTLVHDYESGRFLPEESTYNRLSSVKKIVVLGNILVTMKRRALDELRRKHTDVWRTVDSGKITVGQALKKQAIQLKGEEYFNGSPFQAFVDSTKDLEFGGAIRGELGDVSWAEEVEEYVDLGNDEG